MKYLDEYRDPAAAQRMLDEIRRVSTGSWTLMEVCGGQTHSLLRHGIAAELQGTVELIHGPGCPVCVTDQADIDFACQLAKRPDVMVTSFGDMLRVPGSQGSLLDARTRVGFETTAPATALAVKQAAQYQLDNFSLIVSHVRVQPAMESLVESPENRVQAFLAAGHVCTVMGYESYNRLVERYQLPVVVTGFEPLDLLEGILACVRQLEAGETRLENCYSRAVQVAGNLSAQDLVREIYQVSDARWRGFDLIPAGGLSLREQWQQFDARVRFSDSSLPVILNSECRSFDVMTGQLKPTECPHFGKQCTPETPLGAPMVSSEGACAAYYRYAGV